VYNLCQSAVTVSPSSVSDACGVAVEPELPAPVYDFVVEPVVVESVTVSSSNDSNRLIPGATLSLLFAFSDAVYDASPETASVSLTCVPLRSTVALSLTPVSRAFSVDHLFLTFTYTNTTEVAYNLCTLHVIALVHVIGACGTLL